MTENEAIKELETSIDLAKMCIQNYERKNEIQGYEMAIKALEEVQQYRQITAHMSMSGKNLIRKCIGNVRSTWIR